jgi:LPXTG-motif cell wall-anchored protein
MLDKGRLAAALAACSLAFPAGALAQGAGDNQYEDPFAEQDQGQGSQGGGGQGGNGDMGSLSDDAPGSQAAASQRRSRSGELPRTGADPGVMALLGAGLLLTGAGLRIRVRRPLA